MNPHSNPLFLSHRSTRRSDNHSTRLSFAALPLPIVDPPNSLQQSRLSCHGFVLDPPEDPSLRSSHPSAVQPPASRNNGRIGSPSTSSAGPAFMGQVFSLCDPSKNVMLGLKPNPQALANLPQIIKLFLEPAFRLYGSSYSAFVEAVNRESKDPKVRFFFGKRDAKTFEKRIHFVEPELEPYRVGGFPLEEAYSIFKNQPSHCQFVADSEQLAIAKNLLLKEKGRKAAESFSGVPVFTAENLTIAMATPSGIRWFTPYFFNKRQLDSLMGHSVDHFYKELMQVRKLQRHGRVTADNSDSSLGEQPEDSSDQLLDPPEVQELMDEMGQSGMQNESSFAQVVEVLSQDCVDSVFLGNKWGRKLAGLEPNIPVVVDSFGRRAALAEVAAAIQSKKFSGLGLYLSAGGALGSEDFGFSLSSPNHKSLLNAANIHTSECPESSTASSSSQSTSSQDRGRRGRGRRIGVKSITNKLHSHVKQIEKMLNGWDLFGGGISAVENGSKSTGMSGHTVESSHSAEENSSVDNEPWQLLQPKVTMLGVAVNGSSSSLSDADLHQAVAAATRDYEEKLKNGGCNCMERGPLFIADLDPLTYEKDASQPSTWDGEDNE